MEQPIFTTASHLAQAIHSGDISSVEVIEAHLKQIARHNHELNAIVALDAERARQQAREADIAHARGESWGPLHGVPFTAKDFYETAGLRTTAGFKGLANNIPLGDATVVARMRQAGAILLGKTNMPALGQDVQTNSPLLGIGNNPWDLDRTPGGSTGGGAAAVAAGFTPIELGSDGNGSIRIPAHYCGIYGFKPTEHRVPGTGHITDLPGKPHAFRHLICFGPLARSVDDLKLVFSVIAGPDGHDILVPPVPLIPAPAKSLQNLRLTWTSDFGGVAVSADTKRLLHQLIIGLGERGCKTEEFKQSFDFDAAWRAGGALTTAMAVPVVPAPLRWLGAALYPLMFPNQPFHAGMAKGLRMGISGYMKTLTEREGFTAAIDSLFDHCDALICPVASTPAFTHRRSAVTVPGKAIDVDGKKMPYWMATLYHTCIFNLTGHPVVVIPLGLSEDGLPIGIQVVGRRWHDMEILDIAGKLAEVAGPLPP
ncbi:MAG: amidase, partial [Sulfuriferula sp.]